MGGGYLAPSGQFAQLMETLLAYHIGLHQQSILRKKLTVWQPKQCLGCQISDAWKVSNNFEIFVQISDFGAFSVASGAPCATNFVSFKRL